MSAGCKLTPEITEIICQYIEKGNSFETAAQAVGICRDTIYNWMERGKKEEPDFIQFLQQIKKAQAKAEIKMIGFIVEAMPKNWQAAAWWAERRNREWMLKQEQKIEHTGTINQQIQFTIIDKLENKKDEDAEPTTKPTDSVKADPGDKNPAKTKQEPKPDPP